MRTFLTGGIAALVLALHIGSIRAADDELQVLFNGPGNSNARAINRSGSAVGFRAARGTGHGELREISFYSSKGKSKEIPQLASYTATFPTAISDNELVAGYCSKLSNELGNPRNLNLQAFVWDAASGAIIGLPVLEGHARCMAFGICADGSRISGVCGGMDRMTACVWEKRAAGWQCLALPGSRNSRLLVTSGACISRDGKFICGVDGILPTRWSRQPDGSWSAKVLKEQELFIPKAINDSGSMVGYRRTEDKDGSYRAVVWTEKEGMKEIGVLPHTRSSQALAINNAGLVVGVSEEPGYLGGPKAFVYQNGQLSALNMPKVILSYAYAINEKGQIAGYCGREGDEFVSAFVWTPKSK
jgi:probable HAF family extracellular repeat protein